jgi:hypothetical protein
VIETFGRDMVCAVGALCLHSVGDSPLAEARFHHPNPGQRGNELIRMGRSMRVLRLSWGRLECSISMYKVGRFEICDLGTFFEVQVGY